MAPKYHKRLEIYKKAYSFLYTYSEGILPTPLEDICNELSIPLVPLTRISKDLDMSKEEILSMWGNIDGHLLTYNNENPSFKIAYNDTLPEKRIRFTIAEELSHMILEHFKEPMYSVFNRNLNDSLYQQHEKEATFMASLLLSPPPFFLENPLLLNEQSLSLYASISGHCAEITKNTLLFYQSELLDQPLYSKLKNLYI